MSQSTFYRTLVIELIKKKHDAISCRSAHGSESDDDLDIELAAGVKTQSAVADKERELSNGGLFYAALQGIYLLCEVSKSKFFSSTFLDNEVSDGFICHTSARKCCFYAHFCSKHDLEKKQTDRKSQKVCFTPRRAK